MTSKQFTLSWVVVAVAALLLTACNPIPAELPVPASVSTPGSACAELKEIAREALADAPPSPARARFDAVDRKAFAGSVFGYLCELTEVVGPRESATEEELEAAEFLIDRFTEFGYSPEVQNFGESITEREFMGPPPGPSRNIILELPGRGEGVVILGATLRHDAGFRGRQRQRFRDRRAAGAGREVGAASVVKPGGFDFPVYTTVYCLWFRGDRTARQLALRGRVDRRRISRHHGYDSTWIRWDPAQLFLRWATPG